MKKILSFLSYVPVILVGILGAYIVFHMWQLSERFRHKESSATHQTEKMTVDKAQSGPDAPPEQAKTTTSPPQD